MDRWRLVRDEQEEVLAFLRDLTPEQWNAPSLCAGWRVRDVAVHLLIDAQLYEQGLPTSLVMLARSRFSLDRLNAWWIERNADRSVESILRAFETSLQTGLVARLLGPGLMLAAYVIHHQDMRRPLGKPRTIPPERVQAVLNWQFTVPAIPSVGSPARAKGLHLVATDADWSRGTGPDVSGPGEAIMMALAGRRVALAELTGPGTGILARRLGGEETTAL